MGEIKREKKKFKLLSSIYRVPSIEICQLKNKSSYTQRGLRVGTKNTRLHLGFKRGIREIKGFGFRKCQQNFLDFILDSKR